MGWNDKEIYDKVKGRTVAEVLLGGKDRSGKDGVYLIFEDGAGLGLSLEGDCCSYSFFTDPKQFMELKGTVIREIEERDGESVFGLDASARATECVDDISWHFLVFVTNHGHVTIDWRNDSNGYYDGWVCVNFDEALQK